MGCLRVTLLVICLICVVPRQSDGSFREIFRKLAERDDNSTTTNEISPSPSPVPATSLDSGIGQSPESQPKGETCDRVSNKCDIKSYNVTACVPFVGNGSPASYVLVLNGGESFLNLSIVLQPANVTKNIEIYGRANKVDLPTNTTGYSSVSLNVENGECVIQMGASIPQIFYSYLTPINGTYLLFVAALFVGGTWTCCKLMKRRHHPDGVPYRELEMEQQDSNSTLVIETHDGWDQNWDDEWDEEKTVRSLGTNHNGKASENGASLKYIDTAQWGNDWED